MVRSVEAVYEDGVLRPDEPIDVPEGSRVQIVIIAPDAASTRTPAQILAEIAALPVEGSSDDFSGRDHDRVLYGDRE